MMRIMMKMIIVMRIRSSVACWLAMQWPLAVGQSHHSCPLSYCFHLAHCFYDDDDDDDDSSKKNLLVTFPFCCLSLIFPFLLYLATFRSGYLFILLSFYFVTFPFCYLSFLLSFLLGTFPSRWLSFSFSLLLVRSFLLVVFSFGCPLFYRSCLPLNFFLIFHVFSSPLTSLDLPFCVFSFTSPLPLPPPSVSRGGGSGELLSVLFSFPLFPFPVRCLSYLFSFLCCLFFYCFLCFYPFFSFTPPPPLPPPSVSRGGGSGELPIEWGRARSDLRPGHLSREGATIHLSTR